MKKKTTERTETVIFDAFDYHVHLGVTGDVVASRTERNGILGVYDASPAGAMHAYNRETAEAYLFLPFDVRPATIAHESWHAVRRMLVFCGAELDNETVAYHLGYLVGKIHEFTDTRERSPK